MKTEMQELAKGAMSDDERLNLWRTLENQCQKLKNFASDGNRENVKFGLILKRFDDLERSIKRMQIDNIARVLENKPVNA